MTRFPSPRGFALLIVLWSVVLLALLTTGMTAAGRSDLQLASNNQRAAAAAAAADGGIAAAIFHVGDLAPDAWQADGQNHLVTIGRYAVTIRVLDENGKINPNFAPPNVLAALLSAAGADATAAAAIAQSIAEWHAPGSRDPLLLQYRTAGMAAAPTGQPFRSVAELGLVLGMTPRLLAGISPFFSVYATGPLQLAHAEPALQSIMRGLGINPTPPPPRPTVVDVTADATGPTGSRFIRHAVVLLAPDPQKRLFRIVQWDALPAPLVAVATRG